MKDFYYVTLLQYLKNKIDGGNKYLKRGESALKETRVHNGWGLDFSFPLGNRFPKPRISGITMIIDKGMGLRETEDLLEMGAEFIDFWKLGFATSALYHQQFLKEKIEMINAYRIRIYPGGTFFEIAITQGKFASFLERAKELGFSTIEISDGTIHLPPQERSLSIRTAKEKGFLVLTEIGKKNSLEDFQPELMAAQVGKDLDDGAFKVILEARESGKGVTIYNEEGNIKTEKLTKLLTLLPDPNKLIWEAPLKSQQIEFITMFGSEVNLGNIHSKDVISLESLRRGLRSDTFKLVLKKKDNKKQIDAVSE